MRFLNVSGSQIHSGLLLLILFISCNQSNEPDLKSEEQIKIKLVEETNYTETDSVYFLRPGTFTVDRFGKVYIGEGAVEYQRIHVYDESGSYLSSFSGYGRGPGEVQNLSYIGTTEQALYIIDDELDRISFFSLDSYELQKIIQLNPGIFSSFEGYYLRPFFQGFLIAGDTVSVMAAYESFFNNIDSKNDRETMYFTSDADLNLNKEIFSHSELKYITGDWNGIMLVKTLPYFEREFVLLSMKNTITYLNNRDTLIRIYDYEGGLLNEIAIDPPRVNIEEDHHIGLNSDSDMDKAFISKIELPEYWPYINAAFLDDKDQIWVATNTTDADSVDWNVYTDNGDHKGSFRWKGDRTRYPNIKSDKKIVKDGYFYEMVEDSVLNQKKVVRYRIDIEENE